MIDSFGRGNWNLDSYASTSTAASSPWSPPRGRNDPRCITLRYEDVVADTDGATGAGLRVPRPRRRREAEGMSDDAPARPDARPHRRDRATARSAASRSTKWQQDDGHRASPALVPPRTCESAGPGAAAGDGLRLRRADAPASTTCRAGRRAGLRRRPAGARQRPGARRRAGSAAELARAREAGGACRRSSSR